MTVSSPAHLLAGPAHLLAGPAHLLAGIVSMDPSSSALPGQSTIQQLTNGLGWWALIASLVGLVLGAAAWAMGSHTNNYQYANAGRKAVLASGAAALLIGAAPTMVNFLFQTGHGIH